MVTDNNNFFINAVVFNIDRHLFYLKVIDPTKRLGCAEMGGFGPLKAHAFFEGINWETLVTEKPPELMPYLPAQGDSSDLWSQYKVSSINTSG